jgi:hypothetical protein
MGDIDEMSPKPRAASEIVAQCAAEIERGNRQLEILRKADAGRMLKEKLAPLQHDLEPDKRIRILGYWRCCK